MDARSHGKLLLNRNKPERQQNPVLTLLVFSTQHLYLFILSSLSYFFSRNNQNSLHEQQTTLLFLKLASTMDKNKDGRTFPPSRHCTKLDYQPT